MGKTIKKKIFVAGHTQLTCTCFKESLLIFLSDYVEIDTWCVEDSPVPPPNINDADVLLVATTAVYNLLSEYCSEDKLILIAERSINIKHVNKLLSLDENTQAYVVGTNYQTVSNTISILHNLGFSRLNLVPYYPSMQEQVSLDINVAITPGLLDIVPEHVTRIIDLGGKVMDISTYAELLHYFGIPFKGLNEISHFYIKALLTSAKELSDIGIQNETLTTRLEVILNTVQEAIVALDEGKKVTVYNQAAEKIFKKPREQVIGAYWSDIVPDSILSACVEDGEGVRRKIKYITGQHYLVNANVIFDCDKTVRGVVGTFHPVQEIKELDTQVRRELKNRGNLAKYFFKNIKGESQELQKSISLAGKFALTELTILLEGESGTGKELFAQAIHNHSLRKKGPFVAINFAAIPNNLIESELFGYEDGAFTGARKGGKPGLFEEAHLGTIFLDEIGSATPDVQNRLLRVLEEREIRRLGSGKNTPVDVRVIAATNVDLEELVEKKLFRHDLFYRLCTLPIYIPPLRDRKADIINLIHYFAGKNERQLKIHPILSEFFLNYDWPGNIRELQNVVKYLCGVLDDNQTASIDTLPPYLTRKLNTARQKKHPQELMPDSGNIAGIPRAFDKPDTQKIMMILLSEIESHTCAFKGVGYSVLLKKVHDYLPGATEYYIKKCLKTLSDFSYVEIGRTKQGTRITEKGRFLLQTLQETLGKSAF